MPSVGKNNTERDMVECVLNYTLLYARKIGVKLGSEHWCRHVGKLIEIDCEGKLNIKESTSAVTEPKLTVKLTS
jgi:hypothetical protein